MSTSSQKADQHSPTPKLTLLSAVHFLKASATPIPDL